PTYGLPSDAPCDVPPARQDGHTSAVQDQADAQGADPREIRLEQTEDHGDVLTPDGGDGDARGGESDHAREKTTHAVSSERRRRGHVRTVAGLGGMVESSRSVGSHGPGGRSPPTVNPMTCSDALFM